MSPNERGSLVLVEDNPDDIVLFRRACQKVGIAASLRVVEDGEEVLHYFEGRRLYADPDRYPLPSLVVLDLKLPKKSGLEVLAWLRNDRQFKDLPVVMLTSSTECCDLARARALGILAYYVKPVEFSELIEIARSIEALWKSLPINRS